MLQVLSGEKAPEITTINSSIKNYLASLRTLT